MSDENDLDKPGSSQGASTRSPKMREAAAQSPEGLDMNYSDEDLSDLDAADVGADPAAVLALQVETLQSQIADLTNRLLRSHADLDNLRKRAEREKQDTARYAISSFAKDTVSLVDNFERAVQAVDAAAVEQDPHLKALLEGVTMTEREFLNVLERHGVRRVTPKGDAFDPRLHQAVMERQDASVPNGTVVEVFQSGYTIEDRCLRPAMVVVARGGGKGQPKTDEDPAAAPQQAPETQRTAADTSSEDTTSAADGMSGEQPGAAGNDPQGSGTSNA